MDKVVSLADYLGVTDPRTAEQLAAPEPKVEDVLDVEDPVEFCKQILGSRQFRQFILNGIVLGDLPSTIVARLMDHGWGKPPERVEHTGKDGAPIVTEVRRVIVRAQLEALVDELDGARSREADDTSKLTH